MFKVPKGKVQGLQESAGRFASMIAAFCERLGWSDMECLVTKFQKRVLFGVKAEIVDLTEIPFVKVSPPVQPWKLLLKASSYALPCKGLKHQKSEASHNSLWPVLYV